MVVAEATATAGVKNNNQPATGVPKLGGGHEHDSG
jgi:hypothetical protein